MKYCINCDQTVQPKKSVSGAKKALSGILTLVFIFLGIMFGVGANALGGGDIAASGAMFFIVIGIIIPIVTYVTSAKKCPMCNSKHWKSTIAS